MKRCLFWFGVPIALALLFVSFGTAQLAHAVPPADEEVDALIANAESAGITAITQDATIMGWDEEGMPSVLLREGSNGWTCLADWPASPGNDPQCFDTVWAAWNEAFMAGEDPELDGPGIGYMLAGGSDPSNTDPFAMEPAAGEEWISTPPHMMILAPGGFDAADFATEPKQDEPYIMWDGTPYEHLMVPVVPMTAEGAGDADDELTNIISSAPSGIIQKATILGNPTEEDGDMVVLQEGDSDWVCYADRLVSPGNDPACNDGMWEELFGAAEPPAVTRAGVSYMLAGGSDESNTDPMATGPIEGEEWIATPPHLMLLMPGGFDADLFTTDHGSGYPYIMWDGTPYEHLMVPIADMDAMEMGDETLAAQILAAEIGTFDALIAHDVAGTEAVIAEDFIWINADGARLGREDLLEVVSDMALSFEQPVRDNVEVQILSPDAAVIVYTIEFDGSYAGDSFSADEYTTSIWQLRDGRWQNTLLQSTRRPESEADALIANAESAGITAITQDATIMDWDEEGMPSVLLREGTNGWTCLTDWPASPGNDPQCFDTVWAAWSDAYMAGEVPELDSPGLSYMLAGGSDPSNTDPFAMEPAAGEEWISTPPHMMILAPGGFDAANFATEPKPDEPYIMWDGTPYEHLMVPVVPMTAEEAAAEDAGDADAELTSIMSSAPAGIIQKATILGNPTEEGGDMVVLQEGDSGWVCYADRLVSPGNDPACYDSMWEELFGAAEPPEVTRVGVSYMLAGGSDESNTDPMATGPAEGEEWITTPPHLMLLVPGGFDADLFTTDHGSGYPYIMWDGTPYEHLMVPIADMDVMEEMP